MDQGINSGFVVLIGGLSLIPQPEMIGIRYPCAECARQVRTDSCNYSHCSL